MLNTVPRYTAYQLYSTQFQFWFIFFETAFNYNTYHNITVSGYMHDKTFCNDNTSYDTLLYMQYTMAHQLEENATEFNIC